MARNEPKGWLNTDQNVDEALTIGHVSFDVIRESFAIRHQKRIHCESWLFQRRLPFPPRLLNPRCSKDSWPSARGKIKIDTQLSPRAQNALNRRTRLVSNRF